MGSLAMVLGVILRFALPHRIGGFGLRRFRAHPDEDIEVRVRHRLGEMLLAWSGWVVFQMLVGLPESWVTTVWAPLVIVAALTPSYTARLYAHVDPEMKRDAARRMQEAMG